MKIAICGSGLLALESFLFFEDIGAEVLLFKKSDLGGFYNSLDETTDFYTFDHSYLELTSILGRKQINFPDEKLELIPTLNEFKENYVGPLIKKIQSQNYKNAQMINAEVLRIHKCFLSPEDDNEGRSRLEDLFRVVYKVRPDKNINFDELPIDKEAIMALKEDYESYKDVDIVVDARGPYLKPKALGPADNFAINERSLKQNGSPLFYGPKSFLNVKSFRRIAVVGSDISAAFLLNYLRDEIFSGKVQVQLITQEKNAFSSFFSSSTHLSQQASLKKILVESKEDFEKKKNKYEEALFSWRERPDYERVKYKKPAVPTPIIEIIENAVVSSVDKLYENSDLYLTIEYSPLGKKEGDKEICPRTIARDSIFVAKGYSYDFDYDGPDDEPGFFKFSYKEFNQTHPIIIGKKDLEFFKSSLLKYFSPK